MISFAVIIQKYNVNEIGILKTSLNGPLTGLYFEQNIGNLEVGCLMGGLIL